MKLKTITLSIGALLLMNGTSSNRAKTGAEAQDADDDDIIMRF